MATPMLLSCNLYIVIVLQVKQIDKIKKNPYQSSEGDMQSEILLIITSSIFRGKEQSLPIIILSLTLYVLNFSEGT